MNKTKKEYNKNINILRALNKENIKPSVLNEFVYATKIIKTTKQNKIIALVYFDFKSLNNNLLMLKVFGVAKNKPINVYELLNYGVYDNTVLFDYDYIKNANKPKNIKRVVKWFSFKAKNVLNVIARANEILQ